jgi:hypothetical protein
MYSASRKPDGLLEAAARTVVCPEALPRANDPGRSRPLSTHSSELAGRGRRQGLAGRHSPALAAGLAFADAYLVECAAGRGVPVYSKSVRELAGQGVDVPDPLPG